MGSTDSKEIIHNVPIPTTPIIVPSRTSIGYKNLQEKLKELRKSMKIEESEDDFILVESELI
jgi:hypothetical protein